MYLHRLEARLEKFTRLLELEVENHAAGERTRYNESKEQLQSELDLLKTLARTINEWHGEQQRAAIARMQEKFGKT